MRVNREFKDKKLVVRLSAKEKEAIKKQADKNGTTMSQLLRDTALESLKYN